MSLRALPLALLAALTPSAPAPAEPAPRCEGTVSGAATAKFGCVAEIRTKDGKHYFLLRPTTRIEDVPSYQPGGFELPDAPAARTYTCDDLVTGLATFSAPNKTLYTSSKTEFNRRGGVTLALTSAKRDAQGTWTIRGTYRARLVPASDGKTGEDVVEARV